MEVLWEKGKCDDVQLWGEIAEILWVTVDLRTGEGWAQPAPAAFSRCSTPLWFRASSVHATTQWCSALLMP